MLFNSYEFIFFFLPAAVLLFFLAAKLRRELALPILLALSLIFYCKWDIDFLWLLLASISFNFFVGRALQIPSIANGTRKRTRRLIFITGICSNLLLLIHYKYSAFFLSILSQITDGASPNLQVGALPLGISFYTFTQIAFLVDAYRGEAKEYRPTHYALFVTYFPHLIAGPILHHKQLMPQLSRSSTFTLRHSEIAIGLTIFSLGLFKKVVLADGVAVFVPPIFDTDASLLTLIEAWAGALAYTLQLYFDFSGYSDMAVGISKIFGVSLPFNFNSPYKATSIIDFWRRWHITLSDFLRDYVYIPLGGNRSGPRRRYVNLFLTMVVGGLWHGAGWTFVAWGALHGLYLIANHAWRAVSAHFALANSSSTLRCSRYFAQPITFIAVVIGWVVFRAPNLDSALNILGAMAGLKGISIMAAITTYPDPYGVLLWVSALLAIVFFLPNTQTFVFRSNLQPEHSASPEHNIRLAIWTPNPAWATVSATLVLVALAQMSKLSPFLYFQF